MKNYLFYCLVFLIFVTNLNSEEKRDTTVIKLPEVVITALRYPEQYFEVPLSVTVIQTDKIQNMKGMALNEVLSIVPGVLSQSRYGSTDERITIRGFGARGAGDRSNAGTSRGIKFFLDGIPETEPDGRTSLDNIDISSASTIEVIRSNASAIWGNAAGGVISISTEPIITKPFVKADFTGGCYNYRKYDISSGTTLSSGKLWGFFSSTDFDGYRNNSAAHRQLLNLGLKSGLGNSTFLGIHLVGVTNKYYIPGPLTQEQYDTLPSQPNLNYYKQAEHRFNRSARIGVTLEHLVNSDNVLNAMIYVNPKFQQRSERNTFRDFTRYHLGGSLNYRNTLHISEQFKNVILGGIDEFYQDGAILFYYLKNARRDSLKTDKKEGANNFGAFIQDELKWNEKLSLLLGLRYDEIKYYNQLYFEGGKSYIDYSEEKKFSRLTPKAAISYRLLPEMSVFASFGGGVEVPAGNETDPVKDTILINNMLNEPIISQSFEIGSKFAHYFDNFFIKNVSYDLAFYLINVKNELVPYSGGKFYLPAGKTTRSGAEIGLNVGFSYGVSFIAAFTYSNNKYQDYKFDSSLIDSKSKTVVNLKDNKIAGVPSFYYNLSLKYEPLNLYGLFIEINTQGVDKYFADDRNLVSVPAYNIYNAKAGIGGKDFILGGMLFKLWAAVNNIADTKYASSSFINPDYIKGTNKAMFLEPGMPRNYVIGISAGWN